MDSNNEIHDFSQQWDEFQERTLQRRDGLFFSVFFAKIGIPLGNIGVFLGFAVPITLSIIAYFLFRCPRCGNRFHQLLSHSKCQNCGLQKLSADGNPTRKQSKTTWIAFSAKVVSFPRLVSMQVFALGTIFLAKQYGIEHQNFQTLVPLLGVSTLPIAWILRFVIRKLANCPVCRKKFFSSESRFQCGSCSARVDFEPTQMHPS